MLIYLAHHPEWKEKVQAEITSAARKYCSDPNAALVDQLTSLPIEIWEKCFPIVDLCLRESIRLQSNNVAMRQNVSGKDVHVADALIPNGAFVGYHKADIHKNKDVYPNPDIWNPGRFLSEKMDNERPYTFIGWGAGRHPCCEFPSQYGFTYKSASQFLNMCHMQWELVWPNCKLQSSQHFG